MKEHCLIVNCKDISHVLLLLSDIDSNVKCVYGEGILGYLRYLFNYADPSHTITILSTRSTGRKVSILIKMCEHATLPDVIILGPNRLVKSTSKSGVCGVCKYTYEYTK